MNGAADISGVKDIADIFTARLALTLNKSAEEAAKDIEVLCDRVEKADAMQILVEIIADETDDSADSKLSFKSELSVIATICSSDHMDWRKLIRVCNPDGYHLYMVRNVVLHLRSSVVIRDLLNLGFRPEFLHPQWKKKRSEIIKYLVDSRPRLHLTTDKLGLREDSLMFFRCGNKI